MDAEQGDRGRGDNESTLVSSDGGGDFKASRAAQIGSFSWSGSSEPPATSSSRVVLLFACRSRSPKTESPDRQ